MRRALLGRRCCCSAGGQPTASAGAGHCQWPLRRVPTAPAPRVRCSPFPESR
jgi:hypothetical protein